MPELPEIEVVKKSLYKMINKAKIIDIKIHNRNLRYKIPKTFSANLKGEKIVNISRRSKYLIFYFKKKILLAHLGMTGKFLILKNNLLYKTSFYYDLKISKKHNHILFKLNNNLTLIYNDVRRFGFVKLYKTNKLNNIDLLTKLGVEPFTKKLNEKYFKKFVKNKKKNIKNLLMDQSFISGLGNIMLMNPYLLAKLGLLETVTV